MNNVAHTEIKANDTVTLRSRELVASVNFMFTGNRCTMANSQGDRLEMDRSEGLHRIEVCLGSGYWRRTAY